MPQSETGRLKLVVMTTHLKLMYKFNTIPVKIQAGTFVEIDELSVKFMCKCKWPLYVQIANANESTKTILEKNKFGRVRLTLPCLKTYYKVTVTKALWYWQSIYIHIYRSVEHKKVQNRLTHTHMVNWFSTKVPKQFDGERIIFTFC